MEDQVREKLIAINFESRYRNLCIAHSDFSARHDIKRKDLELFINNIDSGFKYISKDRVFMKEIFFKEFTIRQFVSFKGGIMDFSYLIWDKKDSAKYIKGRLLTLAELVNPDCGSSLKYKAPIASSVESAKKIIEEIFCLLQDFETEYYKSYPII